jgi:hypothetical protein
MTDVWQTGIERIGEGADLDSGISIKARCGEYGCRVRGRRIGIGGAWN